MFWGPLRVTQLLRVEIDQRNDFAVFDLAFANLMQIRPPASIMLEIVGHMPREENVTGIAAIHYALSDVYSRSSNIGLFVEVSNRIDGPAMDSHAHAKLGIFFQFFSLRGTEPGCRDRQSRGVVGSRLFE